MTELLTRKALFQYEGEGDQGEYEDECAVDSVDSLSSTPSPAPSPS